MCFGGGPAGGPGGIRMPPNRGGIPGGGRGGIRSPGMPGIPGRSGGGRIMRAGCIGPGIGIDGIGTYLTVVSDGCGAGLGKAIGAFGGIGIALTGASG